MKKFNKILMSLCAVLLLTTGCSSNALKTAYTKMSVGTGEDQISGYTMNLRLFGLYNGEKIRESVRVQNYEGKNFKVTYSTDLEKIYYVIDGVNYKYKEDKPEEEKDEITADDVVSAIPGLDGIVGGDKNSENEVRDEVTGSYAKTDEDVPFTNTDLYLTSLKSAKKIEEMKEEKIGDVSYETYEFIVTKKAMKKLLAETTLKDIEFKKDIEARVWLDEEGFVHKIVYDLAAGIESDTTLELSVYYNGVDKVNEISLDEINVAEKEETKENNKTEK